MSWAADGQDGNRLHFEKNGPIFFSSLSLLPWNSRETILSGKQYA